MEAYKITVEKLPVNTEEEYRKTERWSGAGRKQVLRMGHKNPDVLEHYRCIYPEEMHTVYGTIDFIKYARKEDVSYERIVIGIHQVGVIDLIREDGEIKDGPDWVMMTASLAIACLKTRKYDLEQIMSQLSPEASKLLNYLLNINQGK